MTVDETANRRTRSNFPKSSYFNESVWRGIAPDELIRGEYTEAIDGAPRQAQSAIEVETRNQGANDAEDVAPTDSTSYAGRIVRERIPDLPETRDWVTMHPLQEWEGYIVNKGENDFVARLRDLTAEFSASEYDQLPEEEATIPLSEISDEDLKRLTPGSIFRWLIGYERAATGTKRRISHIVFRDLPSITAQDKSEGLEWARKIVQSLKE